jgi:hypothetical protein
VLTSNGKLNVTVGVVPLIVAINNPLSYHFASGRSIFALTLSSFGFALAVFLEDFFLLTSASPFTNELALMVFGAGTLALLEPPPP